MPDPQTPDLWKNKTALLLALEKIPFFADLEPDDLQALMDYMSLYELGEGETLFREGQAGQYVAFLVEGKMEVLKKSISGTDIHIATVGPGYAIGEMALLDQAPRSATLKATAPTTLAILAQGAFKQIIEKHPAMGIKILLGFARFQTENLRKTSSRLNDYTHLLATICKQKGVTLDANLAEQLRENDASLVRETQSISALGSSGKFFKNLKMVLTADLLK